MAAMMTERSPMSSSFSRENSMPTRKSSRMAPISMAAFISSWSVRSPSAFGPARATAISTPSTDGCFSRVASTPPRTENTTMMSRETARDMGLPSLDYLYSLPIHSQTKNASRNHLQPPGNGINPPLLRRADSHTGLGPGRHHRMPCIGDQGGRQGGILRQAKIFQQFLVITNGKHHFLAPFGEPVLHHPLIRLQRCLERSVRGLRRHLAFGQLEVLPHEDDLLQRHAFAGHPLFLMIIVFSVPAVNVDRRSFLARSEKDVPTRTDSTMFK